MFDNATPTAIVIFLAVVLMLTAIGSVIFFWTTGHPDDKAAIMSRFPWLFRQRSRVRSSQRSYAQEPYREPLGTVARNGVPALVERLEAASDDELLEALALAKDEDGGDRWAESRIAKFIGGRVEDRLNQVRDVRGTEKPLPAGRVLRVRDQAGERVIPFAQRR